MMTFVTIALGVFVGMLMASAAAVILLFNTRFLKWYMKKAIKLGTEIAEEIQEAFEDALED